jgi:purine-nucleoside phosphorylase
MSEIKPYPTPHINATPADIAPTVLMPGDPLRAKFIAENYLADAVLFNNVRGIQGYTGNYRGTRVSVMASGMGMPSIGIYSYELFHFFGVKNIIRVGSAGGMQPHVRVRDLILGMGACTDSHYAAQFGLPGTFAPTADYALLSTAKSIAEARKLSHHVGNLLSSDVFYGDDPTSSQKWGKMGVLAVEMEAAALYMNAARAGRRALAICTVSDHLLTGEATSSEERQTSFTQMMEVALETAVAAESFS